MFPTVVTKSTNPATVFVTNFTPGSWLFPLILVGIGASFTPWNEPSGEADAVTSDGVTVQVYQKQKRCVNNYNKCMTVLASIQWFI